MAAATSCRSHRRHDPRRQLRRHAARGSRRDGLDPQPLRERRHRWSRIDRRSPDRSKSWWCSAVRQHRSPRARCPCHPGMHRTWAGCHQKHRDRRRRRSCASRRPVSGDRLGCSHQPAGTRGGRESSHRNDDTSGGYGAQSFEMEHASLLVFTSCQGNAPHPPSSHFWPAPSHRRIATDAASADQPR